MRNQSEPVRAFAAVDATPLYNAMTLTIENKQASRAEQREANLFVVGVELSQRVGVGSVRRRRGEFVARFGLRELELVRLTQRGQRVGVRRRQRIQRLLVCAPNSSPTAHQRNDEANCVPIRVAK